MNYLIPANSKKSMLILGFFNPTDLIIFGTGCLLTFILLLAVNAPDFRTSMMIVGPSLFGAFLVMPVPNQHNIRTLIGNIYKYYSRRRTYYWKGWCFRYGEEDDK